MRDNPFNPSNLQQGKTPDFRSINDPIQMPFGYMRNHQEEPEPNVEIPKSTVDELVNLLHTMTSAFEECGMFELAEQSKKVSSLLD